MKAPVALEQRFFGDFILDARTDLYDVAQVYGLELDQDIQAHQPLAKMIIQQLGGTPVVGDQLEWMNVIWTIAEKEDNNIVKVGVRMIDNQS